MLDFRCSRPAVSISMSISFGRRDRHAQFLCMRGVEQHAFHQHSLRLLRALQGAGTNRRIRENQAGRPAGDTQSHRAGTGFLDRPRASFAAPAHGAPERSGRTVGVTSATPALISWHCGALAALFPLVRFGGTAHRGSTQRRESPQPPRGGLTANSKRRSAPRKPVPQTLRGAIAMNCDPAVRSAEAARATFLACEVHRSAIWNRSHTPRRALSAPAGAAAARGFSGSPKNLDRSSICKMVRPVKLESAGTGTGSSETGSGGVAPDRVTPCRGRAEHAGQRLDNFLIRLAKACEEPCLPHRAQWRGARESGRVGRLPRAARDDIRVPPLRTARPPAAPTRRQYRR